MEGECRRTVLHDTFVEYVDAIVPSPFHPGLLNRNLAQNVSISERRSSQRATSQARLNRSFAESVADSSESSPSAREYRPDRSVAGFDVHVILKGRKRCKIQIKVSLQTIKIYSRRKMHGHAEGGMPLNLRLNSKYCIATACSA